ncbi:MAG: M20 family metallopeptidase [Thermoanaerobacteraceae bacterium]|nr:M20 family metallopeptidase [Thermoanaerobacteraceae bacterium]
MTDVDVLKFIDEDELISLTRELVKIPSVYDPEREDDNEEKVAMFLKGRLLEMGFEVYADEAAPHRPNIIAVLKGNRPGKTILLEGHTDVVTPGNVKEWKYDPFGAEIVDGKIYGRGACDTKNNLASAIIAAKAVKDSGIDFPGKIILCIPVDEEGMMIGIKHFIKQGWADDVDAAIICEPEDNNLCVEIKGAIRIVIKVKGKMAHGAMPLSGINPNLRMARLILKLYELEQSEIKRLGYNEYLGYPSITPTIVMSPANGKGQLNVVPEDSFIALDIRTVPGQEDDILISQIENIFKELKAADEHFDADMEVIERRPCTYTDKNEPIVKAMDRAYRELTGKEPVYNGVPGATDGTFLWAWKNIPVIVTGSGKREVPHQRDEYVEIEQLIETTKLYTKTIINYLFDRG